MQTTQPRQERRSLGEGKKRPRSVGGDRIATGLCQLFADLSCCHCSRHDVSIVRSVEDVKGKIKTFLLPIEIISSSPITPCST